MNKVEEEKLNKQYKKMLEDLFKYGSGEIAFPEFIKRLIAIEQTIQ